MINLRRLLQEASRRHVSRVAVVYAAVAFGVLEAADIVIPALGLGEWTIQFLIALSLLGFPVTLILAWIFDLTPRGVVRTRDLDPEEGTVRPRKELGRPFVSAVLLLSSGALVTMGAFFAYQWSREETAVPSGGGGTVAGAMNPRRIAVLPFVALDQTEEGDFFASGIHEDILNQLAKIRSLEVISRTTVLQYRGTDKSALEIGRELNAGSLLEGTIRRLDNRVRVVAQLIDTRTESHIWSQDFESQESDIFRVQSEMAEEIARALQAELTPAELRRLGDAPSVAEGAFERLALGRAEWDLRENRVNAVRAVQLFQEATELDPGFAQAFALLSQARMWLFWNFAGNQNQAELAKEALDRASELAPEAVETLLARGYFYFYGRGGSEEALRYFVQAEELRSSDSNTIGAIGLILRGQGRWDEAISAFERARTYDPMSYNLNFTLGETYFRMRRFSEAERYFRFAATLVPEAPAAHRELLRVRLAADGDTLAARRWIEGLPATLPSRIRETLSSQLAYYRGDYGKALDVERSPGPDGRSLERMALLYHLMGEEGSRDEYADSLRIRSEEVLALARANPGPVQTGVIARAHAKLGVAYALLGEEIDAWVEGSSAVSLLPISTDAFEGADHLRDLAVIYTLIGETDLAVQQLETALSVPSAVNRAELRLDPVFEPLRGNPLFERLTGPGS